MWPFTKKKEDTEAAVEKNDRLGLARDQISAELTKFRNRLKDKNLTEDNVGLWFTTKDVNTKYQVCEITALIKTESKVIGELLQKVINHPNYNVNLYSPKLSHWPSFYDAVKTIMNKGEYGIGVDKQWFKLTIETNDINEINEFIDGICYFARSCINRFNSTKDLDFFKEMEDLRMSDTIDIGCSEIWLKLNPVKAAQYLDAVRIKYKDHEKKYLDLYEDYIANMFANKIRELNRHNSYANPYKCTTLEPEVNIYPRDLFSAQYKEITEEEKRQKICGEFVKKVNNMV
jgi:hypothetical protein